MSVYGRLAERLQAKGMGSYLQRRDQLVIANQNPALPASNSFWVTCRGDDWFVGTWLPAIYRVPAGGDMVPVCEAVFHSSATAIYTIEDKLVEQWRLRRLTEDEIDSLGLA